MKISVIGAGYVGLVTGTIFAEIGNDVVCVDIDEEKIRLLEQGKSPIFEPGLEELLQRNIKEGRLKFSKVAADAVQNTDIIFIAVGTPSSEDGQADLRFVKQVAEEIGKAMTDYRVIVNKSTVPIGTGDIVSQIIRKHYAGEFDVVSNPEFLREGFAVSDCLKPNRVVIGTKSERAKTILSDLYKPLQCPVVMTDVKTAEMVKYTANALLATEIAFINSVAEICERVGADVTKVSEGVKLDHRIGQHAFLTAGPGFGGSCFPKDVRALTRIARRSGEPFAILEAVNKENLKHKDTPYQKLKKHLPHLQDKVIAVFGLAFKANTDDMRESVSLDFIPKVLKEGARVQAFDPVAEDRAKKEMEGVEGSERVIYFDTFYQAAENADVVVILTEWPEFKEMDVKRLLESMRGKTIIDARNILQHSQLEGLSLAYEGVGRPHLTRHD